MLYSPSETDGQWFFPRGRKDIGESLQQAALREAHEEARAFLLAMIDTDDRERVLRLIDRTERVRRGRI